MKVAVLGGAFDPPHLGHGLAVSTVLKSGLVDQVWLVPSGERRDKSYCSEGVHRLAMTRLLIAEMFPMDDRVRCSGVELEAEPGIEGTVELLQILKRHYHDSSFFFVVGSDLLASLPTWRHQDSLRSDVVFLALQRGEEEIVLPAGFNILGIDQDSVSTVSSTKIRELLQRGEPIGDLTTPKVIEYISANHIYR